MSRQWIARVLVGSLAASLLVVAGASAAYAHRPNVKANLVRFDGGPNGFVEMAPQHGGHISLNLPSPPAHGTLTFDLRLNAGAPTSVSYPITGARMIWPFGFATKDQDKVEITNLRVLDANSIVVAELGTNAVPPRSSSAYVFAVPLVWVVDTASDVAFTRGGDSTLNWKGDFTVGFDALRSRATGGHLNNTGNHADLEVSINDGPPQVYSVSFDVQSGKSKPNGRPKRSIPFHTGDRISVRRIDVFDAQGNRFATMGIRMGAAGHYLETVPPPVASLGSIRRF